MSPARHEGKVYGRSSGAAPGSKHYYRRVWSGGKWDEFVETRTVGVLLQVCSGASRLGVVRLDIERVTEAVNIIGDMLRLPFQDRSFDTVACDPPYTIGFPDRVRLQRELTRVARRRLIFKGTWLPRAAGWALLETVLVASHTCQNVGVLSLLEREDQGELFEIHPQRLLTSG